MVFILGAIPLFLGALAIRRLFSRSFAECLAPSVFSAIFLLYFFGVFGALRAGVYAVYAAGAAAAVYLALPMLAKLRTQEKQKLTLRVSPAFVLAALALLWILVATSGRKLGNWDEFSHWGLVAKNMYLSDALGTASGATTVFRSYPPALALLQYYFIRPLPSFSEAGLYAAKDLLLLALLLPFLKDCTFKNWRQTLLVALVAFLLPFTSYGYFFQTLHVDGVMGLLLAYLLIAYYSAEKLDLFCCLSVGLCCFTLVTMKNSGTGLAMLGLGIVGVDLIVHSYGLLVDAGKPRPRAFLLCAIPFLFLLAGKMSWSLHMAGTGTADVWNATGTAVYQKLFASGLAPYQREAVQSFFTALFAPISGVNPLGLTPFSWLLVPLGVTAVIYIQTEDGLPRLRVRRYAKLAVMGYGVWLFALLVLYLTVFREFEAVNLDGFERYCGTWRLGTLTFLCYMLIATLRRKAPARFGACLTLLLCALLPVVPMTEVMRASVIAPQYNALTRQERAPYTRAETLARMLDAHTDSVCFVAQATDPQSSGLAFQAIRYEATPLRVGVIGSWSLGAPYGEKDYWTYDISAEAWAEALYASDYTHLFLYKIDERFIAEFGALFESAEQLADDSLFRIERGEGTLNLVPEAWLQPAA